MCNKNCSEITILENQSENSFLKKLFMYLWLHRVFVAVRGILSLRPAEATLCCCAQASHCGAFSCCKAWVLGCSGFSSCSMWAQKLWCMGLFSLWHVGSSQTRDQTRVPCIGRRILIHCTTREVLKILDWNLGKYFLRLKKDRLQMNLFMKKIQSQM